MKDKLIVYVIVEEEIGEDDFGFGQIVGSTVKGAYQNEEQVRYILGFSHEYEHTEGKYPYKRAYYQKVEVQ